MGNQTPHSPFPTPHSAPPASVLLLTAEDDFADTVRPRLEALGADCDRILGIATVPGDKLQDVPRSFALNRDLARLRDLVGAMPDCRLIVIDPINAYLGSTNSDVQSLLHSLTTIARERGVAVLIVSQLRKKDGAAVYRALGSVSFVAAARASWAICKDPVDSRKRLFLPVKNNLAPHVAGLSYTIQTGADRRAPIIRWSPEPVTQSVDFAIAAARAAGRPDEERQYATKWLTERLAKMPRRASLLREEAEVQGISYTTLRRAFREMGGLADRRGRFPATSWCWSLPGVTVQNTGGEFWTEEDEWFESFKPAKPSPPPTAPHSRSPRSTTPEKNQTITLQTPAPSSPSPIPHP